MSQGHATMPLAAYGALGLPLAMAALPVYVQAPAYYAGTLGLPLAGWQRDSSLKSAFEAVLQERGIASPRFVRSAKTHHAVAAAVESGRADAGYAEKEAAEEAGLGFEPVGREKIMLLARSESVEDSRIKSLLRALSQEEA